MDPTWGSFTVRYMYAAVSVTVSASLSSDTAAHAPVLRLSASTHASASDTGRLHLCFIRFSSFSFLTNGLFSSKKAVARGFAPRHSRFPVSSCRSLSLIHFTHGGGYTSSRSSDLGTLLIGPPYRIRSDTMADFRHWPNVPLQRRRPSRIFTGFPFHPTRYTPQGCGSPSCGPLKAVFNFVFHGSPMARAEPRGVSLCIPVPYRILFRRRNVNCTFPPRPCGTNETRRRPKRRRRVSLVLRKREEV